MIRSTVSFYTASVEYRPSHFWYFGCTTANWHPSDANSRNPFKLMNRFFRSPEPKAHLRPIKRHFHQIRNVIAKTLNPA